jgi:hypothetical protein
MKMTPAWMTAAALVLSGGVSLVAGAAPSAAAPAATEASAWQHHHATFSYFGITSIYTCDGLEGKVRQIMRFLGARADLKVAAQGCPRGPDSLSRSAWVTVDFDTLALAAADAPTADIVPARWTAFKIDTQRPFFMDGGDCELIEEMRPVLVSNFSWRNLDYRTSCTPHEITLLDFRVHGEVLKSSAKDAG